MGKTEILFSKINKNWKKFKTKLNNIFLMMNNHFLLLTLIVEFGIFASEVSKNEGLTYDKVCVFWEGH